MLMCAPSPCCACNAGAPDLAARAGEAEQSTRTVALWWQWASRVAAAIVERVVMQVRAGKVLLLWVRKVSGKLGMGRLNRAFMPTTNKTPISSISVAGLRTLNRPQKKSASAHINVKTYKIKFMKMCTDCGHPWQTHCGTMHSAVFECCPLAWDKMSTLSNVTINQQLGSRSPGAPDLSRHLTQGGSRNRQSQGRAHHRRTQRDLSLRDLRATNLSCFDKFTALSAVYGCARVWPQ